tara:strand:- start:72 stop:869 length:798 start_codon:yes stop_codon:yes gene_type:complete
MNRVQKVIKGKIDFINELNKNDIKDLGELNCFNEIKKKSKGYLITTNDTKKLLLPNACIDYIFTDPPYGDSVPYFEQSILWNTWLNFKVNYKNEVVISNSKKRNKTIENFKIDIFECLKEIYRVLKPEKFFTLTFNSVSGKEWYALINGCQKVGFNIHKIEWMEQKTSSPRQLNRLKIIKGDLLITFKKTFNKKKIRSLNKIETENKTLEIVSKSLSTSKNNTKDLFLTILKYFYKNNLLFDEINFIEVISKNFEVNSDGNWSLK